MGSCVSDQQNTNTVNLQEFKKDKQLGFGEKQPLFSSLYTLLRQNKDLEIIRVQPKTINHQFFRNQQTFNLDSIAQNDLKMLFNFKNILIVGGNVNKKSQIVQKCNPKNIFRISQQKSQQFIQRYPIYSSHNKNIIAKKKIPLLVFQQTQLIKHFSGMPTLSLYINSTQNSNDEVNKSIKIDEIYFLEQKNSVEIKNKIIQCGSKRILILHESSITQDYLINFFAQILSSKYKVGVLNAKVFLKKTFPNADILNQDKNGKQQIDLKNKSSSKEIGNPEELKAEEKYSTYFKALFYEQGKDKAKLERAYNLVVTLLSNIYNHKENENYRKVRKTNKQINQLLGKFKAGFKILDQVGFQDVQGFYANQMDPKYLKLVRIDLDLGYRLFSESQEH